MERVGCDQKSVTEEMMRGAPQASTALLLLKQFACVVHDASFAHDDSSLHLESELVSGVKSPLQTRSISDECWMG